MIRIRPRIARGCRPVSAAIAAVIAIAGSAHAGVIAGYDTSTLASHNTYDLYSGGFFTAAPVRNTNAAFVGAGANLTGIGYVANNGLQGVTMISPQHFVMAAHFPPQGTNQLSFVTANNVVRTYPIQVMSVLRTTNFNGAAYNVDSDLLIGRLASPIPASDGIGFLPVAVDPTVDLHNGPIPATNGYNMLPLLCQGHNDAYGNPFAMNATSPHFGTNVSDRGPALSTDGFRNVVFGYDFNPSIPGEFHAIDGDSGSPSLARIGGQAALVGLHYDLLADNSSEDTLVAYYLDQMNAFMSPDGFQVPVVPIPEPSAFGLLAVGAALSYWRRRRIAGSE